MTAIIRAGLRGGTVHLALTVSGILTDYTRWRPESPDGVGDLYTGNITSMAPALGGAFVDLGDASGFMPDSAGAKNLSEGTILAVRVSRAAQGGKGPRLEMAHGVQPGTRIGLLERGPGPLADLSALHPEAPILADDWELIARLRGIYAQIEYKKDCLAPFVDEIAALAEPEFLLPHGARGTASPTPAVTAIDIDAGAATAERADKPGSQLRLNRAIIPELARQIRLRNLGGAILVDFAGMKPAARPKLTPDLAYALARDPLRPRFLGFSALGFAEIRRPRIRPPLHELPP